MKKLALTVAVAVAMVTSSGLRCEAQSMINSILEGMSKRPRTIETQGTASIDVVPDEVVLSLGVQTFNASLSKASEENSSKTKELIALSKQYGIDGADAQTSSITVTEEHKRNDDAAKIVGYTVKRSVTLDVKDLTKIEGLLADVVKNGANSISGMEFKTTQLRKYRDLARADAAKAALEKATALAQTLGATIGKVQTIREAPVYETRAFQNNRNAISFNNTVGLADADGQSFGSFAAGKISVKATIDVTWELE